MKINPLLIHSVWAILIILIVISNKYAELAKKQENKKHQISLNNLNHRADSPSTPSFNTAKAVEDAVQATQTPVAGAGLQTIRPGLEPAHAGWLRPQLLVRPVIHR